MTDKTITILDDNEELPGGETIEVSPEALDPKEEQSEQALGGQEPGQNPATEPEQDPVALLQSQNQELSEQVKRVSAEFQNFRRRQEEEAKRVKVRIREDIIRTMLPILDNLERTLQAADNSDGAFEALREGVALVEKDARKIFGEHGLAPIEAKDQMFDPALHQAVMMQETSEVPDQTILQELQKGYTLGDRVLRPSMVQVARN